jgi:hypothetical protein
MVRVLPLVAPIDFKTIPLRLPPYAPQALTFDDAMPFVAAAVALRAGASVS